MLTEEELDLMKNIDIRSVDRDSLADLNDISIDTSQTIEKRIASFIDQIKNPYVFRIGEVIVKVNYTVVLIFRAF